MLGKQTTISNETAEFNHTHFDQIRRLRYEMDRMIYDEKECY